MIALVLDSPDVPSIAAGDEIYRSTKTYDQFGRSFLRLRQWRAVDSHCRLIHGYALAFKFVFATRHLDDRNWCSISAAEEGSRLAA